MLPESIQNKIANDIQAFFPEPNGTHEFYKGGYKHGYTAGATAWAEQAERLAEAMKFSYTGYSSLRDLVHDTNRAMSTMDSAIRAIEKGDLEKAKQYIKGADKDIKQAVDLLLKRHAEVLTSYNNFVSEQSSIKE